MSRRQWGVGSSLSAAVLLALLAFCARGQQVLQYGFESREPVWQPGLADAPHKELAHKLTDESAHSGQRSEHIRLASEPGTFIHYTYDPGRAPIIDELSVSLWVKANRPGVQILCRVVLPRERDPRRVDQPLTTLVKGDAYQLVGRWQQLTLRQPVKRLKEQQQLLQAELKREVIVTDAYIDRIVLNLYAGPGQADMYLDDLEVGPLSEGRPAPPVEATAPGVPARPAVRRSTEVQLSGNQLRVGGQKIFPRIIRYTNTPLPVLREAGFTTLWLDDQVPQAVVEKAVNLGFTLIPSIPSPVQPDRPGGGVPATLTANDNFSRRVGRFLDNDAVLCWDLGNNLATENYALVARSAQAFRNADPMRPLSADVWDGFQRYSRGVEGLMLGAHRWPLMTGMELPAYRDWLAQRRQLAMPGTFCWTWIQTHLPEWYTSLVYERGADAGFSEPIGPLPEQVRLMAYTAIGSGYRGLGFWSDRYLADSHTGRDRLLSLALLNQELQMLEPILVNVDREPTWIPTSHPSVQAAVLRTDKAVLVLPVWIGSGAQFVPGQSAVPSLSFVVPQVPGGVQAWEVAPGQVRSLKWDRVVGGMKVTLREFSLAAAVVFTSDLGPNGLVVRFQDQQRKVGSLAAQWAHDQAKEEFAKVEKVLAELEQLGQRLPDAAELLTRSKTYLDGCEARRRNGEHTEAYLEAQRALRPLRIVMRAYWDRAVREMDSPLASQYAVSFYTLPRHYRFWDQLKGLTAATNVLPDGDFETAPDKLSAGWLVQEIPSLDEVTVAAKRVADGPHTGKQCLRLHIAPKNNAQAPVALERTFLALHSPAVRLPAGTPVRITGWIRIPAPIQASADGALFYDSAGGEPLAVRLTGTTGWRRFTLYRRVPESGTINVTLALQGLGTVYFDDVVIEPLVGGAGGPPAVAKRME